MNIRIKWILSSSVLCLAVIGCSNKSNNGASSGASAAAAANAGPAVTVNTVIALRQDVPIVLQASAGVAPQKSVELHPQITSTIKRVHVEEGQFVRAGDLLFTLDDRSDQANLEKAKAQLLHDQAGLADFERQFQRSRDLVAQKFLAPSAADTLQSQVDAQRAVIQADRAAIQAAQVNISYAILRSPMAGRIGAITMFPGSLVQMSTPLVTITQLDPIGVSFTLPEAHLQALLDAQKRGPVKVEANAANSDKRLTGALSFIDNAVDTQAGSIRVKAQFANRDAYLWPGQYVNASVVVQTLKDTVVIPQAAIVNNTRGRFVYTVEADQSAKSMPITVLYSFGLNAAVTGLKGGEKVIVEGKQNLRPGNKVHDISSGGKGKDGGKDAVSASAASGKKGSTE